MKFLDDQGRLFGKINILDLIVLLVVAAGVLFIAVRKEAPSEEEIKYQHAEYILEITGVRENAAKAYREGDTIYDGTVEIGTVKEVTYSNQKQAQLQPDGSFQEIERKLFYDVQITVETDDYYEKDGRFVNGKVMLLGTSHPITNGIINNDATILELQVSKK